jgi:ABC-type multidrug transport system ATPase subunit
MVDTPIMFLDEFSTGMDPILKRAIMASLREESRAGRTIVLTTQVLTEAEELCDDILIINHGRQVARGDLHALKLLAEGVYEVTLTFDDLPPSVEAEVAAVGPLRMKVTGSTVQFSLKEDEQRVLALVSRLAARGSVRRVEMGGASLEDIFVKLTSREKEVW